ncbi:MAG: LysE family translocator [Chloroflexota bacterium]
MVDAVSLRVFALASLALVVIPGPAVLYIVARSLNQGRMAGIVSVLGISVGAFVHVCAAALGLSAILMSSAVAFTVVKYLGAAYLIYLGIRTLLAPNNSVTDDATEIDTRTHWRVFREGAVVNILNPKTALFFFAFLPQFVNPTGSSIATQIIVLGLIFVVIALVSDSVYAVAAGTLGGWLRRSRRFWDIQKYVAGGTYIVLGVATAALGSDNK